MTALATSPVEVVARDVRARHQPTTISFQMIWAAVQRHGYRREQLIDGQRLDLAVLLELGPDWQMGCRSIWATEHNDREEWPSELVAEQGAAR